MWYPILKRFEATSKALQLENIDLSNVISLYTSLKDYIEEIRNSFYTFLEEAKSLSGCETFVWESSRSLIGSNWHRIVSWPSHRSQHMRELLQTTTAGVTYAAQRAALSLYSLRLYGNLAPRSHNLYLKFFGVLRYSNLWC